jgi:hypothetical protein
LQAGWPLQESRVISGLPITKRRLRNVTVFIAANSGNVGIAVHSLRYLAE